MGRTVLLLHELPDGGHHYDWLIERDGAAPGVPLLAFRVGVRIDLPPSATSTPVGCFNAERIADHRAAYLDFEGPVSEGRGSVRRVAEGLVRVERDDPRELRVRGRLGGAQGVFHGAPEGDPGQWRFEFVAAPSPGPRG